MYKKLERCLHNEKLDFKVLDFKVAENAQLVKTCYFALEYARREMRLMYASLDLYKNIICLAPRLSVCLFFNAIFHMCVFR